MKVNLFFDMDGVLAVYHPNTVELMYDTGFFLNRPLDETAGRLMSKLINNENYNVYVLSKAIITQCAREKRQWLWKYFPLLDPSNILIISCEDSKLELIEEMIDLDNSINFLIDDLSDNLYEWENGTNCYSIKYFNDINSRNWLKTGKPYISNTDTIDYCVDYIDELTQKTLEKETLEEKC